MSDNGHIRDTKTLKTQPQAAGFDSFVLEKTIFSNVFEKDIKRIYIYKKAERLAKAVHLVAPAFKHNPSIHDRVERISLALVDAAILPPHEAKDALSKELLALSSVLSIARTTGLLSAMNADLIGREAHTLLEEIAGYEEPRLSIPEVPTLAELAKDAGQVAPVVARPRPVVAAVPKGHGKGHVSDKREPAQTPAKNGRREAILSVLGSKGPSYIKDLSTVIRDVSEKTIQRELAALVEEGVVSRTGERRWTTYQLAS